MTLGKNLKFHIFPATCASEKIPRTSPWPRKPVGLSSQPNKKTGLIVRSFCWSVEKASLKISARPARGFPSVTARKKFNAKSGDMCVGFCPIQVTKVCGPSGRARRGPANFFRRQRQSLCRRFDKKTGLIVRSFCWKRLRSIIVTEQLVEQRVQGRGLLIGESDALSDTRRDPKRLVPQGQSRIGDLDLKVPLVLI